MKVIIFSHVLVFKPPAVLSLGLQFIAPEKQVHRTISGLYLSRVTYHIHSATFFVHSWERGHVHVDSPFLAYKPHNKNSLPALHLFSLPVLSRTRLLVVFAPRSDLRHDPP